MDNIELRTVRRDDLDMLFRWRNLPYLVALSTDKRKVTRDEHIVWFEEVLSNKNRKMFILMRFGKPIGQLRFDKIKGGVSNWTVSIYLLEGHTGQGLGSSALIEGCRLMARSGAKKITAFIRVENKISKVAFEKANFKTVEKNVACPDSHFELFWEESGMRLP